jgi:hypothetical protein
MANDYIPLKEAIDNGLIVNGEHVSLLCNDSMIINMICITDNKIFNIVTSRGDLVFHPSCYIANYSYSVGGNYIVMNV